MKSSNQKLCEITDVIPVRVFPDRAKKMGPIKPMMMSDTIIFLILNGRPAPKHFFAIDPNNHTRKVLLTKDNYNKTTEELFGQPEEKKTNEAPAQYVASTATVVEEPVQEQAPEEVVNPIEETAESDVSAQDVLDALSIDVNDTDATDIVVDDADITVDTTQDNTDDNSVRNYNRHYHNKKNRKN